MFDPRQRFAITKMTILVEDAAGEFAYLLRGRPRATFQLGRDGIDTLRLLQTGLSPRQASLVIASLQRADSTEIFRRVFAFTETLAENNLITSDPERWSPSPLRKVCTAHPLMRVFLELTKQCNLRCAHCYAEAGPSRDDKALTLGEIESLVDQAAELGAVEFDVTGGEPFMRRDIEAILDLLTRRGMFITLYTNGTLLPAEIERLARFSIVSLVVSLDSIDERTHDGFRRLAGAQRRTLDSLRRARRAGIPLRINVSLNQATLPYVRSTVEYAYRELGAASVVVAPLFSVGRGQECFNLSVDHDTMIEVLRDVYIDGYAAVAIEGALTGAQLATPCGVAERTLFISHSGDVYVCPTLTKSESPDFLLGNIRQCTLRQAWEFGAASRSWFNAQCREIKRCAYATLCRGGCRSRAFLEQGSIDAPDVLSCDLFQALHASIEGKRALMTRHHESVDRRADIPV